MSGFAALLRGVNVSGRNSVRMPELAELLGELGFRGVRTYLQSGNAVFSSGVRSAGRVESVIEERVAERFGVNVGVLVRTGGELREVLAGNPFLTGEGDLPDLRALHVTFLKEAVPRELVAGVVLPETGDSAEVRGREVYLRCPEGYGRTKLNNAFWERKLKVAATTRNWKTVGALVEMVAELG